MSTRLRDNILLGCAILGGIAAAIQIFGSFGIRAGGAMPFDLILAISALVNAAIAWWFWRSLRATRRSLAAIKLAGHNLGALNTLKVVCNDALRLYKHLDHDYREQVRYPLNKSSIPPYGETWDYVHVELVTLKSQLDIIVIAARAQWEMRGWEQSHVDLFDLNQSTKMLDLISALEQFIALTPPSHTQATNS